MKIFSSPALALLATWTGEEDLANIELSWCTRPKATPSCAAADLYNRRHVSSGALAMETCEVPHVLETQKVHTSSWIMRSALYSQVETHRAPGQSGCPHLPEHWRATHTLMHR